MSVEEFITEKTKKLERFLGGNFEVAHWGYNSYYMPDFVTVENISNGNRNTFFIEIEDACDDTVLELHAVEIADQLR